VKASSAVFEIIRPSFGVETTKKYYDHCAGKPDQSLNNAVALASRSLGVGTWKEIGCKRGAI
jgi:hypothetical protein